jgi:hypothetical protein
MEGVSLHHTSTQMRNKPNTSTIHDGQLKVVETPTDQAHVEMEIESHVKSIRNLIKKLRPYDRQRYYDGLLSHLLSQPVEQSETSSKQEYDYCNLSVDDLSLIRELSVKIHELYRISESDSTH